MVKQYSQLYLEARRALLTTEDAQTASLYARELLSHVSGKTQEQIISDREMYANQDICAAMESAVQRVLDGEPLAYVYDLSTYPRHCRDWLEQPRGA